MIRGPHHTDLSEESFDYIMNSMIDTTMEIQNAKLFIRPHPRYGEKILYKYLNKMPPEKFVISYDNIYTISKQIDLVVSMWSSMILDALNNNLPVT